MARRRRMGLLPLLLFILFLPMMGLTIVLAGAVVAIVGSLSGRRSGFQGFTGR
jgi:hypothetical protein